MKPTVICMKWGTLYGPEYVNLLARALKEFLPIEHDLICLTERPDGIDDGVIIRPLPEMGAAQGMDESYWKKGGWPKLAVFEEGFLPKGTPCLFVDLDTVITGDLRPMFDLGSGVTMIQEWKRFMDYLNPFRPQKQLSGIFAFRAGEQSQIYHGFMSDPKTARETYRIEQYCLADLASEVKTFEPSWVLSFKRHLLPPRIGVRNGATVSGPPESCKILAFHGDPRPIDVARDGVWGKRFRYGQGPVPYIADYWKRFGIDVEALD